RIARDAFIAAPFARDPFRAEALVEDLAHSGMPRLGFSLQASIERDHRAAQRGGDDDGQRLGMKADDMASMASGKGHGEIQHARRIRLALKNGKDRFARHLMPPCCKAGVLLQPARRSTLEHHLRFSRFSSIASTAALAAFKASSERERITISVQNEPS